MKKFKNVEIAQDFVKVLLTETAKKIDYLQDRLPEFVKADDVATLDELSDIIKDDLVWCLNNIFQLPGILDTNVSKAKENEEKNTFLELRDEANKSALLFYNLLLKANGVLFAKLGEFVKKPEEIQLLIDDANKKLYDIKDSIKKEEKSFNQLKRKAELLNNYFEIMSLLSKEDNFDKEIIILFSLLVSLPVTALVANYTSTIITVRFLIASTIVLSYYGIKSNRINMAFDDTYNDAYGQIEFLIDKYYENHEDLIAQKEVIKNKTILLKSRLELSEKLLIEQQKAAENMEDIRKIYFDGGNEDVKNK